MRRRAGSSCWRDDKPARRRPWRCNVLDPFHLVGRQLKVGRLHLHVVARVLGLARDVDVIDAQICVRRACEEEGVCEARGLSSRRSQRTIARHGDGNVKREVHVAAGREGGQGRRVHGCAGC